MTAIKEVEVQNEREPIPSFVLSWDIPQLVGKLCENKGWLPPTEKAFQLAKSELVLTVSLAFGASQTVILETDNIVRDVESAVRSVRQVTSLPVVTMDPVYGASLADFAINTTRGLNADGTIEEIPRPGYPEISIQLDTVVKFLNGNRSVCLVDAGAYSGDSIKTIIERMRERDVSVDTVILGVATTEAQRMLWSIGIRPVIVNNIRTPIDWIEARDFIPFIPLCGRVVNEGVSAGQLSRALPYLLPEGNPSDWASIPPGKETALSIAGWNASEIIFRSLEEQNRIVLQLSDFVDLPIRVSYPGSVIPGLTGILDIIRAKRQMVQYQPYAGAEKS